MSDGTINGIPVNASVWIKGARDRARGTGTFVGPTALEDIMDSGKEATYEGPLEVRGRRRRARASVMITKLDTRSHGGDLLCEGTFVLVDAPEYLAE